MNEAFEKVIEEIFDHHVTRVKTLERDNENTVTDKPDDTFQIPRDDLTRPIKLDAARSF